MGITTACSKKEAVADAVAEIRDQCQKADVLMVVYFASSSFDPSEISHKMQEAFGSATVFGCTTAGEIVSGQMLTDSIVAMAFGPDIVDDVHVEVLENLNAGVNVKPMLAAFESYYKAPLDELDLTRHLGIVLIDGLSGAEEKIMDKLGYRTNLTIIGGSAGDNLNFEGTFVYANGKAYTNAALLALVKLRKGFDIIKTESFDILDPRFTVTRANEATREVLEFNGVPAAVAYSDAIFCKPCEAHSYFMHHPVGVLIDGKPYVRSPQKLNGESIVFYCTIPEGMEVALLESTDIVRDTDRAIKAKLQELGSISGMINFHCILRTLELYTNGTAEAYGEIFAGIPTIGFSTYGEEYLAHINQTSTILVFK